jgi:nucleotide-binding universal stress UspA family protein
MVKRILVGLAGTPYTDTAIRRAVELAQVHGAEVTGVTVVDVRRLSAVGPIPIGAEGAAEELREHRLHVASEHVDRFIAKFERACHREGVPHNVLREEGDAFKLMASLCRYHDLTIFGLRSVFEYFFEDVDSGQLLCRLVCCGVRPMLAESSAYRPIRRVLVAYSGSIGSAKTLKQFVQMRLWPEATMRIATFGARDGRDPTKLEDAAEYCQAHGLEPELDRPADSARHHLLPYADAWDADLIVMGNSVHGFVVRQLFGEVALHTIQHTDRPLFLSQ